MKPILKKTSISTILELFLIWQLKRISMSVKKLLKKPLTSKCQLLWVKISTLSQLQSPKWRIPEAGCSWLTKGFQLWLLHRLRNNKLRVRKYFKSIIWNPETWKKLVNWRCPTCSNWPKDFHIYDLQWTLRSPTSIAIL